MCITLIKKDLVEVDAHRESAPNTGDLKAGYLKDIRPDHCLRLLEITGDLEIRWKFSDSLISLACMQISYSDVDEYATHHYRS